MKKLKDAPKPKTYKFTCRGCKAVWQANATEGRFSSDQRDGDALIFRCPDCKCDNWIAP